MKDTVQLLGAIVVAACCGYLVRKKQWGGAAFLALCSIGCFMMGVA